ncbi:MAG: DUF4065 domain-containing protein [Candidatus Omnitrophica bacterium]|nr:DUF4065 domain-containing protein [Candidatus Omnitrophota bacterium]
MFQIKSEDQRLKTLKRIEQFEQQIQKIQKEGPARKAELFSKALQGQIEEFRYQIGEFDRLRTNGVGPFQGNHISQIGPYLINARIASGMTQAELAKKIGVSQPMVYKYELDEYQGHSLDVLAKVAKALGVRLDVSGYQVSKAAKYEPGKLKGAILFFLNRINNVYLGKTKLMKLIYYADYEWIQKKSAPLTGDTYIALQHGPVPKHSDDVLAEMEKQQWIQCAKTKFHDYDQNRYIALAKEEQKFLTHDELHHLEEIAKRFEHWTATQMSESTHEEWPWLTARVGEEIKLYDARQNQWK